MTLPIIHTDMASTDIAHAILQSHYDLMFPGTRTSPHNYPPPIRFYQGFFWFFRLQAPSGWCRLTRDNAFSMIVRFLASHGTDLPDHRINEVLNRLRGLCEIPLSVEAPCFFDSSQPADMCVSFSNINYDLRSEPLEPDLHDLSQPDFVPDDSSPIFSKTPMFFSPVSMPVPYDPTATCPRWLSFLAEVSASDPLWISNLQQFFGYCLLPNHSVEKALFLQGVTRSGKTTIVEILRALLGPENCTAVTFRSLGERFAGTTLLSRRLITISEANIARGPDASSATNALKQIIGRDPFYVEMKNRDPFPAIIPAKVIIVSNDLPYFDDANRGLSSKLIVLPFTRSFEDDADPLLRQILLDELPGIAQWALSGARPVRDAILTRTAHSLFPPLPSAQAILTQIHESGNPVRAFSQEMLVPSPSSSVSVAALHTAYEAWRERTGAPELSLAVFGRHLTRESVGTYHRATGGRAVRKGIAFRPLSPAIARSTPGLESATLQSEVSDAAH